MSGHARIDEIGTPGYTAEAARRAAPTRPVPAEAPRAVGALRIRAGVAAVLAGYGWLWTLGAFATRMWTTLGAAVWALRLAGRSKDAFASAASIATANVAAGAAGRRGCTCSMRWPRRCTRWWSSTRAWRGSLTSC